MNPFKVTESEYNENFNEKKGFLRSLIFLIFKGNKEPSKLEETIINQTIIEYYREFFTPFEVIPLKSVNYPRSTSFG